MVPYSIPSSGMGNGSSWSVFTKLVRTGWQPRGPGPSCREAGVGCGTGGCPRPLALVPLGGRSWGRQAGGRQGELCKSRHGFTWGCVGEGGKDEFLPALPGYCAFSGCLTERSSYVGDRLVLGAELQMINCIKKKKQCFLAELCNGLHINLREILCGITAASQEFGCRSQEENGSPANRRSRR